ncbi:hypothetical protein YC2023_041647 [Brassica napus]
MAAMRCESKRIWCRDYINGKGTLHLRNWLWIKYYNQIVEDRLLKELAQIFERVKSLDLHPTEPWQFQAFDYSFMQLSCSD